jgi:hypothetical protein
MVNNPCSEGNQNGVCPHDLGQGKEGVLDLEEFPVLMADSRKLFVPHGEGCSYGYRNQGGPAATHDEFHPLGVSSTKGRMDLKPQGGDVILLLERIGLLEILQGGHVRLILVSSYRRGCMELLFKRI